MKHNSLLSNPRFSRSGEVIIGLSGNNINSLPATVNNNTKQTPCVNQSEPEERNLFEHNLITKASITTVAEPSKMVEELSIKVEELREKPVPAPQKDSREAEMIAVSEIEERAERSSNVLFNLKESGESAEEIKRDDEAKLKEIAMIMDTKFEALKAIRIGKKETGKTPPLKVIFQSREERNAVLAKAKKNPYQQ